MQFSKTDASLFFSYCPGIGPKTFRVIIKVFGSSERALKAKKNEWKALGFSEKLIEKVFKFGEEFNLKKEKERLAKLEINYISSLDDNFSKLLKEIIDCPIGLFYKGKMEFSDEIAIAVVGTRKATSYGREVTKKMVKGLVYSGLTIVSGLARGIDGIAHRACLEASGRTIGVLGCGLDYIYPPEHKMLAADIVLSGALVSEYPPGTEINPGNFPSRNRIVSGLSLGVLVTEGAHKSGSKITAMQALEQNREVFAVPGPITSQMSEAPSELIQMGAKLVTNEQQIIDELNINSMGFVKKSDGKFEKPEFEDKKQEKIWEILNNGMQHIDDICREMGLTISEITTILTMMELSGLVKNLGNGEYMTT